MRFECPVLRKWNNPPSSLDEPYLNAALPEWPVLCYYTLWISIQRHFFGWTLLKERWKMEWPVGWWGGGRCPWCWTLPVPLNAVRRAGRYPRSWTRSGVLDSVVVPGAARGAERCHSLGEGGLRDGWVSAPGLQPPVLIPLLASQHAGIHFKLRSDCGRIQCAYAGDWNV